MLVLVFLRLLGSKLENKVVFGVSKKFFRPHRGFFYGDFTYD